MMFPPVTMASPLRILCAGTLNHIGQHLHDALPDCQRILVVSDDNTLNACGWRQGLPFPYHTHRQYNAPPTACLHTAETLAMQVQEADAIIAIGSGTINDLCKYAAHQCNIPYAVIATAPSMNGYLSSSASLEQDGYKQSFPATPPRCVIADTELLVAAPARLIASGIGDTLCYHTVQADLKLNNGAPTLPEAIIDTAKALEHALSQHSPGTPYASSLVTTLMQALFASGEAMAKAGNSAPASQGEHMIAHVLEMLDPDLSSRHYHGEIIAVTTLTMARLQTQCSGIMPDSLPPFPFTEIADTFNENIAHLWQAAYHEKCEYSTAWQHVQTPNHDIMALETLLQKAGCPTTHEALGISADTYALAVRLARYSRNRLTWLDMTPRPASR